MASRPRSRRSSALVKPRKIGEKVGTGLRHGESIRSSFRERAQVVRALHMTDPVRRERLDPEPSAEQCSCESRDAVAVSACVRAFKERTAQVAFVPRYNKHRSCDGLVSGPALKSFQDFNRFCPGSSFGDGLLGHACRPRIVPPGSIYHG